MIGTNPIYTHFTKEHKPPSMRVVVVAGVVAGIAVLAFSTYDVLRGIDQWFQVQAPGAQVEVINAFFAGVAGWFINVIAPIVAYIIALIGSRSYYESEAYQLVKLTNLSERDVTLGLVRSMLFRLRWLWGLMIALLPATVFPLMAFVLSIDTFFMIRSVYYAPLMLGALLVTLVMWGLAGVGLYMGVNGAKAPAARHVLAVIMLFIVSVMAQLGGSLLAAAAASVG